jgi:molybdate transport system substrate-binding protein
VVREAYHARFLCAARHSLRRLDSGCQACVHRHAECPGVYSGAIAIPDETLGNIVNRLAALLAALLGFSLSAPAPAAAAEAQQPGLLVFAAASLTNVLEEISTNWTRRSGVPVKLSFAASSALARQIEAGGKADIFISADEDWMDYLGQRTLIAPATRREIAGNSLVLIAPADSKARITLRPGVRLDAVLGTGRLATGDPETVPAGRYARSALQSLGVWDQLKDRLVPADNVRGALNFVARGEVPLGVVYATDAKAEKAVRIVATFPEDTHAAITYPAAATSLARPESIAYLTYLSGADAAITWKKYGFQELRK